MSIIINGMSIRNEKLNILKEKISHLDRKLTLVVIEVGNTDASSIYIKQKQKVADFLGISFYYKNYANNISNNEIIAEINKLNNDDNIDGIIIQMPLPQNLDRELVLNSISPLKDVDGLTKVNQDNLDVLIPCTAKAVIDILAYYNIEVSNKKVAILGRSILVGKPLAKILDDKNAKVTVCHSKTTDLKSITLDADIVISAVGKKHLVTRDMIKENAVVIDVGINIENNKLYGDVDFANVKDKCSYITPVPGGVGPLTVYELFNNLLIAYELRKPL